MVLIKPLKSHTTNQFICGIRILSDTHPPIQIGQRIEIRVEKVQTRRIELTGRVCSLNKTNGSPFNIHRNYFKPKSSEFTIYGNKKNLKLR